MKELTRGYTMIFFFMGMFFLGFFVAIRSVQDGSIPCNQLLK